MVRAIKGVTNLELLAKLYPFIGFEKVLQGVRGLQTPHNVEINKASLISILSTRLNLNLPASLPNNISINSAFTKFTLI